MRFSRFKQQMEGIQPQVRKPKTSTPRKKERQKHGSPSKSDKSAKVEGSESVKPEPGDVVDDAMQGVEATMKSSPVVKPETKEEDFVPQLDLGPSGSFEQQLNLAPNGIVEQQAAGSQYFAVNNGEPSLGNFAEAPPSFEPSSGVKEEAFFKEEPVVKLEPYWD